MGRNYQMCACAALASALLVAATAGAQLTRGNREGTREERRLNKLYPIDLATGETRLVDRRLIPRLRCRGGILIIRPLGQSAAVQCLPRL